MDKVKERMLVKEGLSFYVTLHSVELFRRGHHDYLADDVKANHLCTCICELPYEIHVFILYHRGAIKLKKY